MVAPLSTPQKFPKGPTSKIQRDPAGALALRFKNFVETQKFFSAKDTVLIGVSGGADSMVLLHLLNTFRKRWRLKLVVVHFNHKSRGKASDRDARFVEQTAERLKLPFEIGSMPEISSRSSPPSEAVWRNYRQAFYKKMYIKHRARALLLAHHQDDQAETVLMRLMRGAGLRGLAGMRLVTRREGLRVVRPLLRFEKQELLAYLKQRRLRFREDVTNRSTHFFRNRVRRELIPYLDKHYAPHAARRLARSAESLAEDDTYLGRQARKTWRRVYRQTNGQGLALNWKALLSEDRALRFRHLERAFEKVAGFRQVDFEQWKRLQNGLEARVPFTLELAGGLRVFSSGKHIVFSRMPISTPKNESVYRHRLDYDRPCSVHACNLRLELRRKAGRRVRSVLSSFRPKKRRSWIEYADADQIRPPLAVRNRRPGDRFQPFGSGQSTKIKNFMSRAQIPSSRRAGWPLVLSGNRVVWVPGYRLGEAVKVTPATKHICEFRATPLHSK